jgi:putative CocE/NonD family hydrolase
MRLRTQRNLRLMTVALFVMAACLPGSAQGLEWIKQHYTKHEYRIPMRDGVRLFVAVYSPKDTSHPYPILLQRTPYSVGPYGEDQYKAELGPSPEFAKEGYIFAYEDVRGAFMSEGTYENMRPYLENKKRPKEIDESSDTYDTIDWLVKHIPDNNGRVGQWGISYPGFYTAVGMIGAHPALKAVSPQAPVTDWFASDDFHHNGALFLPHAFGFFSGFGHPRPEPTTKRHTRFDYGTNDGYQFYLRMGPLPNADKLYLHGDVAFWNEMLAHDTKDAFWKARDLLPHIRNIHPAVLTVGGWFDAQNLYGALQVYYHIKKNSPETANHLVMGPWWHGGWFRSDGDHDGVVRFDAPTSHYFEENIERPFFDHYLKGTPDPKLPEAYVFETGTNQWRKFATWPPKDAKQQSLYLHADGKLSFDPPKTDEASAYDQYVSDPSKPVPFMYDFVPGMPEQYMVADQRFAGRRPDVLVYETDPLDHDVTLAGPVLPRLWVSTSGTDSDFVVKLIDVYPDRYPDEKGDVDNKLGGYEQMVRGDIIRGKFRDSLEKPEPFTPGKPTAVNFPENDIFHTFRRGHRIMIQIQSTWFPLADLNPQRFEDINTAKASDFQKATERIYHTAAMASQVKVGVMPAATPAAAKQNP